MNSSLLCPICQKPLFNGEGSLSCENGHAYDVSSSGYVNLLPPGRMKNKRAGDDRDMIAARRCFLSAGYYEPILDRITNIISDNLPSGGLLIDAGCGEGYYTNGAAARLPALSVLGIDASKHACDASARLSRRLGISDRASYVTASLASMPVPGRAADIILSLFSPCVYTEFARVVRPDGYVLIGSAGKRHLTELKTVLYGADAVRDNVPISHGERAAGTSLVTLQTETLEYETTVVGGDDIRALFSMTPYYWRSPKEGTEALLSLDSIKVTVAVDITLMKNDAEL